MDKITLKGILKKAKRLWEKTDYSSLDTRESIFNLLIHELEQLEKRIEGMQNERIGMGSIGIKNRGYDPASWNAGTRWACDEILGEE